MATSSPSFLKLANNDFSVGSSFVVNKGANGSTSSAVVVFNAISGTTITSQTFKIGSVKVGGQNLFTEHINIDAVFGVYSDSSGFASLGSLGSCTVSESDKTTNRTISKTATYTIAKGYYPAVKITVSSASVTRGAEVVMSNFQLSVNVSTYTVTVNVSPTEGGSVTGAGTYNSGNTATVTAVPANGYKFVGWANRNLVITVTANPYIFTVNADTTFYAVFEKETINNIQIGKTKPSGIYYTATTKTITFVIADAVSITPSGADTVDDYHLVVSNTAPSGATPIKGVQVGTTYVYTT